MKIIVGIVGKRKRFKYDSSYIYMMICKWYGPHQAEEHLILTEQSAFTAAAHSGYMVFHLKEEEESGWQGLMMLAEVAVGG
ncbi:hypothetical protein DMENIID0001_084150 [Sergentomyia squamirostris]